MATGRDECFRFNTANHSPPDSPPDAPPDAPPLRERARAPWQRSTGLQLLARHWHRRHCHLRADSHAEFVLGFSQQTSQLVDSMSDDEQLVEAACVAWAALLRADWRGLLTRAASKLPMDKLLALHPDSLLTNMSGPMFSYGEWAYENTGPGVAARRCGLAPWL